MARGKSRDKANILPKQIAALDLRKSGLSYRKIGERLGISHGSAYLYVMNELQRLTELRQDKTEELRELELERLDRALEGIMPFIDAGNSQHVIAMVKLVQERAKLLGLYAPERHKFETWEDEALAQIRNGELTYDLIKMAFDESMAERLFKLAGVPVNE